jgi:hypothetical protein
MGDLRIIFLNFKEKIKLKNHLMKSNHRVLRKNKVDIHGAPVFAPDYNTNYFSSHNSHEHSMYIDFYSTVHTTISQYVCHLKTPPLGNKIFYSYRQLYVRRAFGLNSKY